MAANYISFSTQTQHGGDLRRLLNQLEEGHRSLDDLLLVMVQMLDGDGSSSTHFPLVTTKFGFDSDAKAKAAYDELSSLAAKFSTDNAVTNVKAALAQAFARFG